MAEEQDVFHGAKRAMVVVAHPDDPEFSAGGTVALMTSVGIEVTYVICTDGGEGGFDLALTREQMRDIRINEQMNAAKVLGVRNVEFLGYLDGLLTPSIELRKDITRMIRKYKPDIVITQVPVRGYTRIGMYHPDHLAAGEACLAAVYPAARNARAFRDLLEEGLEAHTVRETWLASGFDANYFVDITETFDKKVQALKCHESQFPPEHSLEDLEKRLREWSAEVGKKAGYQLAEGFIRMETG
jgi:LmbE family N-acetylglucosaminyl deacetylase